MNAHTQIPNIAERSRIVDTHQSAQLYGLSVPHFRRLYRTGKVPAPIKIGIRKYGWPIGVILDDIAARNAA